MIQRVQVMKYFMTSKERQRLAHWAEPKLFCLSKIAVGLRCGPLLEMTALQEKQVQEVPLQKAARLRPCAKEDENP